MKASEKQTIIEVISSLKVHRMVLDKHFHHGQRLTKGLLQDLALGMDISLSKLNYILKKKHLDISL